MSDWCEVNATLYTHARDKTRGMYCTRMIECVTWLGRYDARTKQLDRCAHGALGFVGVAYSISEVNVVRIASQYCINAWFHMRAA